MKKFYDNNKEAFVIFGISLLYAFIFGGYTLCNQYLLVLYPEYGIYLSSILFCSMFICTLFAPYVSYYLMSVKWTVIVGTFGTTFWILTFNLDIPYLIVIATILSGIGTGLYRSHQFILIKKLYPANVNRNMTISLSVFNLFGIITTPIIFIMLFFDISIYNVLKCFTVIVFISQILLMLIEDVKTEKKKINYLNLLKTKIWFLLPLSQVQAINFTTFFVFFPKNVNENFNNSIFLIATLALVYSFIYPFATYLVGILFNKTAYSKRWIYFAISIIFSALICVIISYILDFYNSNKFYDYILICSLGLIYGIYDSIIYTINMITIAELFDENIFCIQRIFYCFNVTLFVAFVKFCPSYVFLGFIIIFNVLSLIGFVLLTSTCNEYTNQNKDEYEEII